MPVISKKILLVILGAALVGCSAPRDYKKILEENPKMTITQAKEKLGKPSSQRTYFNNAGSLITVYEYRALKPFSVIFGDSHVIKYGHFSKKDWLLTYRDLGLMGQDEYEWEYAKILAEEKSEGLVVKTLVAKGQLAFGQLAHLWQEFQKFLDSHFPKSVPPVNSQQPLINKVGK